MNLPTTLRLSLREFKRPGLWLGIWLFGWLLCVCLSLMPPVQLQVNVPSGDKLGHFLAYTTLSAWSVLIFARTRDHLKAALSLVVLGILMELAQGGLTSDRLMDGRDVLANTLGVIFGQLVALGRTQTLLQRWDSARFR